MTSTATILAATRNAMVRIGFISSDAELTNYRCCCWSKWYGDFSVVQLKKTIPLEFLAKPKWNFIEQCSYAIWRPLIGKKKYSATFWTSVSDAIQHINSSWTIFQLVVCNWHDGLNKSRSNSSYHTWNKQKTVDWSLTLIDLLRRFKKCSINCNKIKVIE